MLHAPRGDTLRRGAPSQVWPGAHGAQDNTEPSSTAVMSQAVPDHRAPHASILPSSVPVRMSGILWNILVHISCILDRSNRSCHEFTCISFMLVMSHVLSYVMSHVLSHVMSHVLSHVMSHVLSHVMSHVLSHVISQEKSHVMSQDKSHVKSHSCKSHS